MQHMRWAAVAPRGDTLQVLDDLLEDKLGVPLSREVGMGKDAHVKRGRGSLWIEEGFGVERARPAVGVQRDGQTRIVVEG